MENTLSSFGSLVFNDAVMRARVPAYVYKAFHEALAKDEPLTLDIADVIAAAMKEWAMSLGATHFTHWFQPMTGMTAEKHDAFLQPEKGVMLMAFSGKALIKGEQDASSFPSGGLRATFEARGYTAWDPTSSAFIKDNTLCVPTAFCSYRGEALDKKTPLLRSMDALNVQARRVLRLIHQDTARVVPTVGAEQEYFLVDRTMYTARPDLVYTGRTLFGARPSKGQELDDHFFGALKTRVLDYMRELDSELWKLGIPAKTRHNEVAPGQHELAPVFETANIAADHNQLTMEMMKKIAGRHGMVCLLHEKPFAGVNGSGKHVNWSITNAEGQNLLKPGQTAEESVRFYLFLSAVIQAVDRYSDLLRISVASASNDNRLGGFEAPPPIVSIFLGDELTAALEAIGAGASFEKAHKQYVDVGVNVLPRIRKDSTDRNRTSPFAFTGDKFEFRSPGSSFSVSGPTVVLNTIVAEQLKHFADTLEAAKNFDEALHGLIADTLTKHGRIIFNGNNYTEEWVEEAQRRGLPIFHNTAEALDHYMDEKNVRLFTEMNVFKESEIRSRYEILLENYAKTIHIEALTMLDMTRRAILPALLTQSQKLAEGAQAKTALGISCDVETSLCTQLSVLTAQLSAQADALDEAVQQADAAPESRTCAQICAESIVPTMRALRALSDQAEMRMPETLWPYPSYGKLMFSVY